MNRIYRSIWNDTCGTFVAASENARSAGKKSSPGATAVAGSARFALKALALSLLLSFGANLYALPTGGVVSAGSASISSATGSTTITQSTQNAAINWQSFNIAPAETVRFVQPNSSSVALNRVLGSDPSSILGSLSANGKVFLVNPNGILFSQGASVNVGGLVASTLNITDSEFMAGTYKFSGAGNGSVLNQGSINADGGYVALLGANVSNEGVISARLGTVALAAGNAITLDVAGDGLLNVTVNQGAVNALVQNGGLIRADGGQVLLTAQSAGTLLQSVVNNTGVIRAQTLENHNGMIKLLGDMQSGTVNMSGTLDASGTGAGQTGGRVTVTGQHVGLFGGQINASGDAGGGTVLIGGDFQGKNPSVQNAAATYMSADSTITADAITNGNGGKVVLWANDTTRAYGSIKARGGAQGGDGGLIETSGHYLDVADIKVNASAPNGRAGTWLLDPNDITIQAAGAETNVTASPNFTSTNDSAIVTTATIQTALNAGTSVIITTGTGGTNAQAGNINVNDTLTWTAVAGPTLTLNAANDVIVNAAITATTGSFAANAGRDVTLNAATKTTTGSLTFNAGNNVNLNAVTTVVTGNITSIAGQNVNVAAASTVTRGDMAFRADNDGTGPGAILGGTVAITCGSNCLTITTGNLRIRFNPVSYATTGDEITAYAANLTGGGSLDAKAWVFGKGENKPYDGLLTATVNASFKDPSNTLPVGVTLGAVTTPLFDTKDVGTNKLITFGRNFTDPVYALFAPFGTPVNTGTTRADITKRDTNVSGTRVYDQTLNAAGADLTTVSALIVGDLVTVSGSGTVADKTVATSKAVSNGGLALASADAGNYNLLAGGNTLTITKRDTNLSGTRVYDQTLNAAGADLTTVSALIVGDLVTVSGSGTVADKTVATSKAVSNGGLALASADAGNYNLLAGGNTLSITPLAITGDITADNQVYNANNAATILTRTLTGAIVGDTVSYSGGTATFSDKNVASGKTVTGTGLGLTGTDAGNYTVNTTATTTANITPASLTVTASNVTKTYGQTPTLSGFTTTALVNGETVGSVTETSPGTVATAPVAGSPYAAQQRHWRHVHANQLHHHLCQRLVDSDPAGPTSTRRSAGRDAGHSAGQYAYACGLSSRKRSRFFTISRSMLDLNASRKNPSRALISNLLWVTDKRP